MRLMDGQHTLVDKKRTKNKALTTYAISIILNNFVEAIINTYTLNPMLPPTNVRKKPNIIKIYIKTSKTKRKKKTGHASIERDMMTLKQVVRHGDSQFHTNSTV